MAWVIVAVAGLLEMVWALLLKRSEGFTRVGPALGFASSPALGMYLLAVAPRTPPVGTAYAVWTGIGAAGTAIVGMVWLGESRDPLKILSLALLIAGIAGLQSRGGH